MRLFLFLPSGVRPPQPRVVMLPIEEALAIVINRTSTLDPERISLDRAFGRLLRESIIADLDLPPFDRARMDGYAFQSASTTGATPAQPCRLTGVGEVAAGNGFSGVIEAGEAVRIMTGAAVPPGADAVERIEVIEVEADGSILLRAPVPAGRNITLRAHEVQSGATIAAGGVTITPAVAAVLATFGYAEVVVARRPRVALISTGSELVRVDEVPAFGQIRDSNTSALAGYVAAAGGEVVSTGVVTDDFDATVRTIEAALELAEVVLLSGGVSMGDYDLVKPALRQLGAAIHFERVAMHPGKPTVFATHGEKLIFGLPGNPVSVAVAFALFARPALRRMLGAAALELPRTRAICTANVKGAPPRRSHQPGRLSIRDGQSFIEPLRWSGSGDLVGFMNANALFVVPEDCATIDAGQLIEVILLDD